MAYETRRQGNFRAGLLRRLRVSAGHHQPEFCQQHHTLVTMSLTDAILLLAVIYIVADLWGYVLIKGK